MSPSCGLLLRNAKHGGTVPAPLFLPWPDVAGDRLPSGRQQMWRWRDSGGGEMSRRQRSAARRVCAVRSRGKRVLHRRKQLRFKYAMLQCWILFQLLRLHRQLVCSVRPQPSRLPRAFARIGTVLCTRVSRLHRRDPSMHHVRRHGRREGHRSG